MPPKKPELVQKIIALKGKVIVDSDISNLCKQILKLNDTISQLHSTNEKIRSELPVLKNVNTEMEERIISLDRRNNTELSGIPNNTPEDKLEKVVIDICHNSVWKLNQKTFTIRVAIIYQFLDIIGTLIKEL